MANSYLNRTSIATPSSRRTFTMSAWVKKTDISNSQGVIWIGADTNNWVQFKFESGTDLRMECRNSGSNVIDLTTNRKFRDVNAWYHILAQVDTTQATESNRVKLYVNGIQETSFATATYPSQNLDLDTTTQQKVGLQHGTQYFNGYISHAAYVDGSVVAPTVFGETDSTSGIWKFKSPSGVTWGTNGFHLKFENSGALGTDSSGNSNTFTVNGNLKQALDTPSNVYATLNPLANMGNSNTNISNGNTRYEVTSNQWGNIFSTLAFSSGKFYAEAKVINLASSSGYGQVGVADIDKAYYTSDDSILKQKEASAGITFDYRNDTSEIRADTSVVSSNLGNFSNGDIIGFAADMDNKALYIHLNGTYFQIGGVTGVPTSGASKTGAVTIPAIVENCTFIVGSYSTDADFCMNFGNGYFQTTAITSAGSNGNGSLFEYDVPSGYYALNTKNINTYG